MRPRPRRLSALSSLAALLALSAPVLAGTRVFDPDAIRAGLERQAISLAKRFAPKPSPQPPGWALRKDAPLATVAVLADCHYDDSGKAAWTQPTRDRLLKVLRYLNESVKPQAVVLLGDLVAFEDGDQLRRVKALLDANLPVPYHAVAGNHDGPKYEEVFGARDYSVCVGGVRFVAIGITNWHWDSGWGNYDHLPWLAQELDAHSAEPSIVLTHNPVVLPTFLNAGAVLSLLDSRPHVLAVLAGHLHVDYEVPLAKLHLGLPMLIRPPYGFKTLRIYRDCVLIFTHEERDGAYRQVDIYQKVEIPTHYRSGAK